MKSIPNWVLPMLTIVAPMVSAGVAYAVSTHVGAAVVETQVISNRTEIDRLRTQMHDLEDELKDTRELIYKLMLKIKEETENK